MTRSDDALLNEIVETIAGSGFDSVGWLHALDLMARFVPNSGVALQVLDRSRPELNCILTSGVDPSFERSYLAYYGDRNPWVADMQRMSVGRPGFVEEMPSYPGLHRTEFYNDWVRPQMFRGHGGAMVVARGEQSVAVIAINADARRHELLRPRIEALLKAVLAPAQNALNLARLAPVLELYRGDLVEAVERPAVVLADGLKVVAANGRFEECASSGDAVLVSRAGRLGFTDAEATKRLEGEVKRLVADRTSSCPNPLLVRRPFPAQPLIVTLTALPGPKASASLLTGLMPRQVLAVLVDPDRQARVPEEILRRIFGLTRSECAVANALANGSTLEAYAETHRVSKFTVRNQLRSVCEKTGVRRQSDLVGLVLRLEHGCRATPG